MRASGRGLRRLRSSPAHGSSVDARLARQLRILAGDGRLPTLRSARGRVPQTQTKGRWLLAVVRLAAAGVVLLAVGGGATAGFVLLRRHVVTGRSPQEAAAPETDHPIPAVPAPARRLRRAPAPAVDIPLPEPAESPAPPAAPVEAVAPAAASEQAVAARPTERRGARRARCCRAEEGDARPTPEIAAEADLLRRALLASRSAHDDRGALALLDAYDARFPRGALGWEAAATRAQVLLHLGDRGGALAILDRLPLSDIGRPAGLIVTRGELRSLAGRCQEALLDFELALRTASRLEAAERARAVYGRASCRARTGDAAGAERDRQQYLDEFPEGPAAEHLRGRP